MEFVKQFLSDRNGNGHVKQNGARQPAKLFNPYLNARREWNSQIDRAFSSLHVWQLLCLACLLIALASVAGITYIGSKAKFVPYVIEVDKLGETVAIGPALAARTADPRVIRASLASFIADTRLVTPDFELQRKAIFQVYGMLRAKDPATVKMNEFLNDESETSPFKRASKTTVNAVISTVLPLTEKTWEVDWTETSRDRDGAILGSPAIMRATLEIYVDSHGAEAKQADIERNPIGLYVRDINWQQR